MPDDLATTEFLKTSTTPRPWSRRAAGSPLDDVDDAGDAEEDVELDVDEEEEEMLGDVPNDVVEEVDMSLDAVDLPKRPRKPKAAAGPANAKAEAKAKDKAKAGEDLVVVPPARLSQTARSRKLGMVSARCTQAGASVSNLIGAQALRMSA